MIMYGIPNCDTVRKARKYLDANQVSYTFYDFKKQGLTLETIKHWLQSQPIDVILNKRSTSWKKLTDEQKQALASGQDLSALTEMPTLVKRPVLETQSNLLFGFKEAEYQSLIK